MSAVSVSQIHQNSRSINNTYTRNKANFDTVIEKHCIHFHQETYTMDKLY